MNGRFTKLVLFISLLISFSAYAQENAKNKKQIYEPFVSVINSLKYVSIGNGNLSSLGLQYSDAFNKMAPSLHLSLSAGTSKKNMYGISYDYTYSHNKIADANLNSNMSLYSIGLLDRSDYVRRNLFASVELNASYLHYRNRYIPWDTKIKRGTVTAHGFEVGISCTAGYIFEKGWGLGLQCGINAQQLYKWLGDERFIDQNSYNGGLFTSKCNTIISPYVGIALYLTSESLKK